MKRRHLVALLATTASLAACGASDDSRPSEITTQASFSTSPSELTSGSTTTTTLAAVEMRASPGVENLQQQLDNKIAELIPRGFPEDHSDKPATTVGATQAVTDMHP